MTKITYDQLVAYKPFFSCQLLAGWKGRKNIFAQYSYNQLPHLPNSMLLIDDPKIINHILEEGLNSIHTSGVLLLGKASHTVNSEQLALATQLKKPILLLEHGTKEQIEKKLHELFSLDENLLMTIAEKELTINWLDYYFQTNIEHVIRKFKSFFGQKVFFYINTKTYGPIDLPTLTEKEYNELVVIENEYDELKVVRFQEEIYYCYDIKEAKNKTMCSILLYKDETIQTIDKLILKSISTTITTWLKQNQLTQSIHEKYTDQFLFDVLHNNLETEQEMIELGKLRNIELNANSCVVVLNLSSNNSFTKDRIRKLKNMMDKTVMKGASICMTYLNYRLVAIVTPTKTFLKKTAILEWLTEVKHTIIQNDPSIEISAGVGRFYHSILDIYKSFQEAKIALQMLVYGLGTNGIIHYDNIGYVRLLAYIHSDLLEDFSNQYIGLLEKYDLENESDLTNTLYLYCNNNGDIAKTADQLFIHANTLRQRLRKIEAILTIDLDNYNDLVNIILSLKINQQMNS